MLRYFLHIPPTSHFLLLGLIVLLRLPAFSPALLLPEESYYLVLAEKLQQGAHLYSEAWHAGPPLMAWLFHALWAVFGSSSWWVVRVGTALYIYLAAIYYNGILAEYKLFRQFSGLPAFIFVFLASVPWYSLEMSASLLVLWPVVAAFHAVLRLGERRRQNYGLLFQAGLWMGLSVLVSYKVVFILLGLLVAYLVLRAPRLDELLALVMGGAVVTAMVLLMLFFNRSLTEFFDIGILYYLDRSGLSDGSLYRYDVAFQLRILAICWGPFLLMALLGFLHYRARYFNYVVKLRALETTMALWLGGVLLALLFKLNRLEFSDFILLIPPVVFYAQRPLQAAWLRRFRVVFFLLVALPTLYMELHFWGTRFPDTLGWLRIETGDRWLHGGTLPLLQEAHPLLDALPTGSDGIWIMADTPEWYRYLGRTCAFKYTDFRIAYYKFGYWENGADPLYSRREPERDIYLAFTQSPPAYIIDPREYFPLLQARFPALAAMYEAREVAGTKVFFRRGSWPSSSP
ncbi:MAG: hypothetical protein D6722_12225 [Bacteroidetes bacterium]|nr:MAG: hypothetical protein D6722_12225 [Bacteroidota bacterium]